MNDRRDFHIKATKPVPEAEMNAGVRFLQGQPSTPPPRDSKDQGGPDIGNMGKGGPGGALNEYTLKRPAE